MAYYNYNCEHHGIIVLELRMAEAKDHMSCPVCKEEMKRVYSPISDIWVTSGAYGKKSN
jgi:putative FmdB family regulatory protein